MEFELTIRGDTVDLAPFLDLLAKNSAVDKARDNSLDPDIPEVIEERIWTEQLMEEFWNDISEGARELFFHCAVEPGRLTSLHRQEEFICDEYKLEGSPCLDVPCKYYQHWQSNGQVNGGLLLEEFGWTTQHAGARRANISRTLSNQKYEGLPSPITRLVNKNSPDARSHGEGWYTAYNIIGPVDITDDTYAHEENRQYSASWVEFVFLKWLELHGYNPRDPERISAPRNSVFDLPF